jgi:hypothetical protein
MKPILSCVVGSLLAAWGAAWAAAAPAATASSAAPPPGLYHWRCAVAYLPERSTWQREVSLRFDAQGITTVLIDGLAVYSFQLQGTRIATALDNERIIFDPAELRWQSDFRGYASGQGHCERLD